MRDLTTRQQNILDFIVAFTAAEGFAPSLREISEAFGIASTNGAKDHLLALERKGAIHMVEKLSRALVVCGVACPRCHPEIAKLVAAYVARLGGEGLSAPAEGVYYG